MASWRIRRSPCWRAPTPLLSDVDITEVAIAQAQQVVTTQEVLVAAEGAPLLVRGFASEQRFAYLAFSLRDSNLAVQLAFPVLGDRLINDLAGIVQTVASLEVGAAIPVDGSATGTIRGPDDSTRQYGPVGATTVANRRGFWTVTQTDGPDRVIAVNAGDQRIQHHPGRNDELPAGSWHSCEDRSPTAAFAVALVRMAAHRPVDSRGLAGLARAWGQ